MAHDFRDFDLGSHGCIISGSQAEPHGMNRWWDKAALPGCDWEAEEDRKGLGIMYPLKTCPQWVHLLQLCLVS